MPWPWVILARIPHVVAGEAPADGEGETEVKADVQAEGVDEAEAAAHDSEAEVEEDAQAEEVDEAELDTGVEVEADNPAKGVDDDESELDSEEEVEEDAQAEGVDDAELSSEEEDEEDEADVEHRADFSIPVALPPRITVMTAATTAQPVRNSPDMYPYVLGVGSGCILFNFGVEPFCGVCFADRPYQSNLIVVRHFDCSGVKQGHPVTATAERIPPRHGKQAVVANIESIGFVSIGHGKAYVIAELMVHKGRRRAMLVHYSCAGSESDKWFQARPWFQETTQNPLPNDTNRHGEWVPSGVVSFNKILWWFDLSWGIISFDPFHKLEEPPLRFHRLPEGRALDKAPPNIHDRRCITESQGGLRYVEIILPEGEAATVSMWSWIPAADGNDETIAWEMEYAMSFAEIWEDDSYKATRLPRKVPVLVLVCPSDANLVYFALELEERLFSINVPERRVVEFIEDSYELVTPWPVAPSCRYVLPWFLPLKIAQAVGMDPFAGSDAERLEEEYDDLREKIVRPGEVETSWEEEEVEVDWDLLGPVVLEDLPEITDSDLPVDESSEEETTLSVAMDPETLARLKAEVKKFAKDHEGPQSQDPGPGDDAGEGAS